MRSHVSWGRERNTLKMVWKLVLSRHVLRVLRGSSRGKSPKRTISGSSGLGLLQLVSEQIREKPEDNSVGNRPKLIFFFSKFHQFRYKSLESKVRK